MALKETEFGGRDTTRTEGMQTAPHVADAHEQLRLLYATDPNSIAGALLPGRGTE